MPARSRPAPLRFVGFLLLLLLPGCHRADPHADAALFLQRLFGGKTAEAYQSASTGFQATVSERSFEAVAHERGFVGASLVEVGAPQTDDADSVKVEAEAKSAAGEKMNLVLTLAHENRAWRLYSLRFKRSVETGLSENPFDVVGSLHPGSFKEPSEQTLPDDAALRRLVKNTLLEFNRAIRAKSFSDFYTDVSMAWQAQVTERQLQTHFQAFIDHELDISAIADSHAEFDVPPAISSDGLLEVEGHYPTHPLQIQFKLKYVHEATSWKLFGIDVVAAPPATAPAH
jgi:hypothetical protein